MTTSLSPVGRGVSQPLLLLMATATGLCAGSNYFNQPLLDSISRGLGISESLATATVTVAQVAYALGLLFLVPLGDLVERRALSVTLMLLAAVGLAVSGFAGSYVWLVVGTAMSGLFSVSAQVLVPFAATLAKPEKSGQAVGTVMSGLLIGILLARSVAGILSGIGGWQTVYRAAAVVMVLVALALWRALPTSKSDNELGYVGILKSMSILVRDEQRLRSRALLGGVSFAAVSTVFATMAFLLSAQPYDFDDVQIGLVGLAGVAGAAMATVAGRLADRGKAQWATGVGVTLLVVVWVAFGFASESLVAFLIGMVVADLALQSIHVSNQNVIYALEPEARARLTAVYMTTYFIGAAVGSALGGAVWTQFGWLGVCVLGGVLAVAALFAWFFDLRVAGRSNRENTVDPAVDPALVNRAP